MKESVRGKIINRKKKKQIPCHDTDVDGDEKTQTALAAAAAVDAAVDAAGAAVDVVTCER